ATSQPLGFPAPLARQLCKTFRGGLPVSVQKRKQAHCFLCRQTVNSQRQTFRNPRSAQSPVFGLPYRKIDLLSAAVNGKRRTANSFGIGGAPAGQAVLTGCLSAAPQRFVTVQTAFAPSPASKYRSALILSSALSPRPTPCVNTFRSRAQSRASCGNGREESAFSLRDGTGNVVAGHEGQTYLFLGN